MEPVSSSDEDSESSSYSSESKPSSPHGKSSRKWKDSSKDVTSSSSSEKPFHLPDYFDDLPSEDSCLSDDNDDNDDDESSNNQEVMTSSRVQYHGDEQDTEEDQNLGDRIYIERQRGKRRPGVQKEKIKEKALEIAHDRLKLARKRKVDDECDEASDSSSHENPQERKKKRSKHAPTCASSLRPSFYKHLDLNSSGLGVHIGANKYKASDPRFQSLSGHLNQDVFDKRYSFLEEKVDADIDRLQKNIAAMKQTGKKGQKQRKKLGLIPTQLEDNEAQLKRLLQEKASRRQAQITRAAKQVVKRKLQEDVASGKQNAYHLKRKDRKKLEMEARLEQLRKIGGDAAVAKTLAKRRKKKMSKHSSLMPKIK